VTKSVGSYLNVSGTWLWQRWRPIVVRSVSATRLQLIGCDIIIIIIITSSSSSSSGRQVDVNRGRFTSVVDAGSLFLRWRMRNVNVSARQYRHCSDDRFWNEWPMDVSAVASIIHKRLQKHADIQKSHTQAWQCTTTNYLYLAGKCSGNALVSINAVVLHWNPVSSGMGDCLRAGKLSHCVTSHPGQLSPPSLRGQ